MCGYKYPSACVWVFTGEEGQSQNERNMWTGQDFSETKRNLMVQFERHK